MRGRKSLLLLSVFYLSIVSAWAERIDLSTARKVAESVAKGSSALRSSGDLSLVYMAVPGQSGTALRSDAMTGTADYFVFNFIVCIPFWVIPSRDSSIRRTCRKT